MTATQPRTPRDQDAWARPVERLSSTVVGAPQDTVTGRRVTKPAPGLRPDVAEDVPRPPRRR